MIVKHNVYMESSSSNRILFIVCFSHGLFVFISILVSLQQLVLRLVLPILFLQQLLSSFGCLHFFFCSNFSPLLVVFIFFVAIAFLLARSFLVRSSLFFCSNFSPRSIIFIFFLQQLFYSFTYFQCIFLAIAILLLINFHSYLSFSKKNWCNSCALAAMFLFGCILILHDSMNISSPSTCFFFGFFLCVEFFFVCVF